MGDEVMQKKGIKITAIILGAVLAIILIGLAIIFLSGNQFTVARCIVTENGSLYMVYDDSPVKLNYDGDTDYKTGDKLLIAHQSAFAESYPEQTRAYFVMKLGSGSLDDIPQKALDVLIETGNYGTSGIKPGGVSIEEFADVSVAWANYYDGDELIQSALNFDKMGLAYGQTADAEHLPIFKVSSVDELEQFKTTFADCLVFDSGYNEIPSFMEATDTMNADYFAEKTVFIVYVAANSGSYRYGVNSVYKDADNFCIHIEQTNNPEGVTMDMAGWLITVAVDKSMVEGISNFDADLNNI